MDAAKAFPKKIVTQVVPLKAFYEAEDYHQDYAEKNPDNPYIQVCDIPKVHALQAQFPELFQEYRGEVGAVEATMNWPAELEVQPVAGVAGQSYVFAKFASGAV